MSAPNMVYPDNRIDTTAATERVSAAKTICATTSLVATIETAITQGSTTTTISPRTKTTDETRCTKTRKNQYMSVKSRDQIKNHSNHHDRNNVFEFKKIHQLLTMDGESDLVLWKQIHRKWRLIKCQNLSCLLFQKMMI